MQNKKVLAGIGGALILAGIAFSIDNPIPVTDIPVSALIDGIETTEKYVEKVDTGIKILNPGTQLLEEKFDDVEMIRDVVLYAYKTNQPIIAEQNELVERRTSNSRTFSNGNTNKVFFDQALPKYYKDENGDWFYADYATTTVVEYQKVVVATRGNIVSKLVAVFYPKIAFAATTFITSGTTWNVPADWNSSNNSIEAVGCGGDGSVESSTSQAGGGGGAYAKTTNQTLTPSSTVNIQICAGNGEQKDTRLMDNSNATSTSAAFGLVQNASTGVGGKGGLTASSTGSTLFAGGKGGNGGGGSGNGGGGGGGAASASGNGSDGVAQVGGGAGSAGGVSGSSLAGGTGGTSAPTAGGAGGNGTEWDATHGSGSGGGGGGAAFGSAGAGGAGGNYGGGGGGAGKSTIGSGAAKGAGAPGIIVITYTAAAGGTANTPSMSVQGQTIINGSVKI